MREQEFALDLINRFNYIDRIIRTMPYVLGGTTGSDGGGGVPPGGIDGQLIQTRVAGDLTESFLFSSGSVASLLDNLNNIRAWLSPTYNFWADTVGTPASDYLYISSGSWHYQAATKPLLFLGGNTPQVIAPTSGSRFDLLIVNTEGVLDWIRGAEGDPPVEPNFPDQTSGSLPLWMILARSTGAVVKRYDDTLHHYIFRDYRPFLNSVGGGSVVGVPEGSILLSSGSDITYDPDFTYNQLTDTLSVVNAYLSGVLTMPTGAVNKYVWTSDGAGAGSWQSPVVVGNDGVPMPIRGMFNFLGTGVQVVDNSANNRVDITITGGTSGSSSGSSVYQWYADGWLSSGSAINGVYFVPMPLTPVAVDVYLNTAGSSGSTIADVQYSSDGASWTSLFLSKPTLLPGQSSGSAPTIAVDLVQGQIVRANIDESGEGAKSLSINLRAIGGQASGSSSSTSTSDSNLSIFYAISLGG